MSTKELADQEERKQRIVPSKMTEWDMEAGDIPAGEMTEEQLEFETLGYIQYRKRLDAVTYSRTSLEDMVEHRRSIFEKYKASPTKEIRRLIGMGIGEGFFVPADYDGTILDADDVYAVIYCENYDFDVEKNKKQRFVLWILLTNDDYLPVLPMVHLQKISLREKLTGKKENDYLKVLEKQCRNLKYPVCTVEQFEELICTKPAVAGRISKSVLMEQLYDIRNRIGLYDPRTITCEIGGKSLALLRKNGYVMVENS